MTGTPSGFEYVPRGSQIEIRHDGRLAATLRGRAGEKVMAQVPGNYKRGNEHRG